jgi:hypothetical protein
MLTPSPLPLPSTPFPQLISFIPFSGHPPILTHLVLCYHSISHLFPSPPLL